MAGEKALTLADVADIFATTKGANQRFHGKLFSYIPPDAGRFAQFLARLSLDRTTFPNNHPATVIIGRLASVIPLQSKTFLSAENGQLRILSQLSNCKLPDCEYLALISPVENGEDGYNKAHQSINFVRSLVALAFGKLPFYSWIADFDFDAKGQISLPGDVIRMPLHADFFKIIDADLMREITERLALQQDEYRQRLQRACNFFDLAMDQPDEAFRFSSYWIALEIIVGGRNDAIRTALSKAYGHTDKAFADQNLLYKEIADIRHDLIHKGRFSVLRSYQERLLQLYFWDIVIYQIGLRQRQLALALARCELIDQEKQQA
jgi:hypothetical protein